MLTTDPITYNVRERGRQHRGQDRNFDTRALAALINGPEVQEKVKHGDMLGYFGHFPRTKFGIEPRESAILDGKVITLPVAIRTVELSADDDGNITHRAEFLDSNEGRLAQRLYQSKAGGFSSAITPVPGTSPVIPKGFYGFDYVYEPNYTTNRGHAVVLDGVEVPIDEQNEVLAMLDAAAAEGLATAGYINTLFDSLQAQHQLAIETMEAMQRDLVRARQENADLVARIARGTQVLDSADSVDPTLGVRGQRPHDYERFRGMPLAKLADLPAPVTKPDGVVSGLLERVGMRGKWGR